jgi:hypothetical protein
MAIERSASHLQALIHIRLKSTLVNLSKGDGFSMIDGIHQLNVFPELSICCHTSSFCVCRITGQIDYPDGLISPLCGRNYTEKMGRDIAVDLKHSAFSTT